MLESISDYYAGKRIILLWPHSKNTTYYKDYKSIHVTTGRKWVLYELKLGINPEILINKNVLNFGSGSSNIKKKLHDKDIKCNVINFDLNSNETETKNLSFIQGNGLKLPFKDNVFDFVLALWSTYQVLDDKKSLYQELMRVGEILHIGPIFKNDFFSLKEAAKKKNFNIIICQPFKYFEILPFSFSAREDYDEYFKLDKNKRIKIPEKEKPEIITKIIEGTPKKVINKEGSSTIVLKKTKY